MFARSCTKGDQNFPSDNGINLLPGSLTVYSGVRGNLPVFTTTRTGSLSVPIHGNGVSFKIKVSNIN